MATYCNSYPPFGICNNNQQQQTLNQTAVNMKGNEGALTPVITKQHNPGPKSYGGTSPLTSHQPGKNNESAGPKINILPRKPDNHRLYSLAVLICSCPLFGLLALIYSFKVDRAYKKGDIIGARLASEKARKLSYVGVICGIMDFIVMAIIWLVILYGIWHIQQ